MILATYVLSELVVFTSQHLEYDPSPTTLILLYFFTTLSPFTVQMGSSIHYDEVYYIGL